MRVPRWPEAECLHENTVTDRVMTFGEEDPVTELPTECVDCGKVFEP